MFFTGLQYPLKIFVLVVVAAATAVVSGYVQQIFVISCGMGSFEWTSPTFPELTFFSLFLLTSVFCPLFAAPLCFGGLISSQTHGGKKGYLPLPLFFVSVVFLLS